jgi:hypothetical protein
MDNLTFTFLLILPILLAIVGDVPLSVLWPYAVVLGIIGLSSALTPIWLRRQVRRAIQATPSLREPQTYHFTPDVLRMSNPLGATELRWDAVLEAAETDEFVLLYYMPKCAYYVPKRIIGARLVELREFLRRQLASRAAGLPDVDVNAAR